MEKFPDYAAPTKIAYASGRPTEIHLRKCRLVWEKPGSGSTGGKSRERVFDQGVITLGAMEDNDFAISDDTVSRHHCKIMQEQDGYVLVDLGSTNGTFINRVRIREAYLQPGCTVQLGKVELKFFFADEKVPIVPSTKDRLGLMIGRNIRLREIYGIIEKIASTNTTVVIEGETGTGKEVVAQTIHQISNRAGGPLMVFDCGAVPENLIESELFGHEKGSFTGALVTRQGLFEMANGGTLFLDELGELNIELQPKLLRVLEQREIRRVGSNKAIKVDVRVIAATNRTLEDEVRAGRFREDLFYRLSVVRLRLPPLRERSDDIPLLIEHFLKTHSYNRRPDGTHRVEHVDREAMDLLISHRWPGNVRELVNAVERAISFAENGTIRTQDLPETIRGGTGVTNTPSSQGIAALPSGLPATDGTNFKDAKERWVSAFEREFIVNLLRKNNGNISHAAKESDIDRKYFRKLMKKYGIDADDSQSEDQTDDTDD